MALMEEPVDLNTSIFLFMSRQHRQVMKDNQKYFADLWESVAGAILLDGGLPAVNKVVGGMLCGFFSYYIKFEKKFLLKSEGALKA